MLVEAENSFVMTSQYLPWDDLKQQSDENADDKKQGKDAFVLCYDVISALFMNECRPESVIGCHQDEALDESVERSESALQFG